MAAGWTVPSKGPVTKGANTTSGGTRAARTVVLAESRRRQASSTEEAVVVREQLRLREKTSAYSVLLFPVKKKDAN